MTTTRVSRLFNDLSQGARAITSSRRLARQVTQRYADWQVAGGAEAWPTPRVRALEDWLLDIWQNILAHQAGAPRLLSDDQELLLWEQVIRRRGARDESRLLLQLSGTARAARRTWQRLHDWRLETAELEAHRSADTEAFLGWAAAVRETLFERRWLTRAELPRYLVDNGGHWLPREAGTFWWMGFDTPAPVHRQLMALLEDHGCPQHRFHSAGFPETTPAVAKCSDPGEEWQRAARWARAELETDPYQSLGIICPDLGRDRERIEEILEDVLHPELAWRPDAPRCFHLSLGRPLPGYPVVSTALDLLRCTRRRIPFDVLSRLLRSPYVGGADDEWTARADLELTLRRQGQETFSLDRLAWLAGRESGLEKLLDQLAAAREIELPEQAEAGAWAGRFTDWLRAFGWPGDRSQNSQEYQIVATWREQLSSFASLGAVQGRWTLEDALKKLAAMAAARVLQFHDDQAPLQVMGAAEAAGLWFDKLWLAEMSDAVWPPPPQPDPFIPVSVQKAHGMPDASAEAVLARARVRTTNMLSAAGEVLVSFAARDGEAPAALSPLFRAEGIERDEAAGAYGGHVARLQSADPPMESVDDRRAPPLHGDALRGGVSLVADQARCPFRALAHHRLQARELVVVAPGLDPAARGKLVHRVAQAVWQRLGSREALDALEVPVRWELVGACVAAEVDRLFADTTFQARFLEIEAGRLTELFMEWLDIEVRREPFRVAATELETRLTLAGIELALRVDRIDELPDGRQVMLDYKTGPLVSIREWIDPRMEEPQLPMYALTVEPEVAGLAFAGIRRGECELRGVGVDVEDTPGLRPVSELGYPDMNALAAAWRAVLETLVTEHRQGRAEVAPKSPRTCKQCDAMSLCRIFERTAADA